MRTWPKFLLLGLAILFLQGTAHATTTCTFTMDSVAKTMTLDASCWTDATIFIPDGYTLDGANFTITAVDPPGGHFLGAIIKNAGASAFVKNLKLDASGLADVCDDGDNRLRAILFEGAGGSIMNNTILAINQGLSGCQEGNGIEVRNAPFDGTHPGTVTVTITGNTVSNYQKNGITANGDVAATITENTVSGLGPIPFIAQNGIQLGYGATGIVMRNKVNGSWYTGANWTSSGILVFEANDVMIHDNEVTGSQSGIVVEAWCYLAPSADENRIMGNKITGSTWGVIVDAIGFTGYSTCSATAGNNKVVNNTISGDGDPYGSGVFVGAYTIGSGSFAPSAVNNKVIRNTISGFATQIDQYGAAASKVHANVFQP
ncbi:MAG TPA: right-handed parallel beta-helix repeat-containing protein [Candidatus Nitrosotenuis sp.]|nr:right-handed parallel beta-helix repeat-containing protein [Candidatus Nitrosotenuis sp.]